MNKLLKAAQIVWKVTRWITGTVIAFLIAYAANLAVIQGKDVSSTSFVGLVNWLFLPGTNRIVTLSVLVPLFIITMFSGILATTEQSNTWSASMDQNRYRKQMLAKVRAMWITGVLEHSLYGAVLIALGLKEQQDAIANPWRLIFQQSDQPEHLLPTGTRITEVFDQAGGELLILGEPGSGKTTLLLELTRDLIDRAGQEDKLPMPVIFNLSSWAIKKQELAEWLVEELYKRYQVPHKLGRVWVDTDQVVPLLDGLDEMNSNARPACIEAINAYRQKHMVPSVLCSRKTEYLAQTKRVVLRNAVVVQPLTAQQIDDYISSAGRQLAAVRVALHEDKELQKLAATPLMLSVLSLAYQGKTVENLQMVGPFELRRQEIFATYVQRMLQRRGISTGYTSQQTIHWLKWMAHQMTNHEQTTFSFQWMGLGWFPQPWVFRWLFILSSSLVMGLLLGLLVGLLLGVPFGLLAGLRAVLYFGIILIWPLFLPEFTNQAASTLVYLIGGDRTMGELRRWFRYFVLFNAFSINSEVLIISGIVFGLPGIFWGGLLFVVQIAWFFSKGRRIPEYTKGRLYKLFGLSQSAMLEVSFSSILNLRFEPGEVLRIELRTILFSVLLFWLLIGPLGALLGVLSVILFDGIFPYLLNFQCDIILRLLLRLNGNMPLRYGCFLDYATDRILLRKVGNGYIFTHRLLQDYFASLDDPSTVQEGIDPLTVKLRSTHSYEIEDKH